MTSTYDALIDRIATWAGARADIRAAVIIGSRARQETPADAWSDLDLLLITTNPRRYITETDWLRPLGEWHLTFLEQTGGGAITERRVLFVGGLDVDFIPLTPELIDEMLRADPMPPEVRSALGRGVRPLVDKDGIAARMAWVAFSPPKPPTQAQYDQVVHDLLYHALWTAKKWQRGEFWTALHSLDGHMKWRLLRMVEWHTLATRLAAPDTWHAGRFLERWADPRILTGLRTAFAHYDAQDILRALTETLKLFRWVAIETGQALGFHYPEAADRYVDQAVETLRRTDSAPFTVQRTMALETPSKEEPLHMTIERSGAFQFKGPVTLVGPELKVGDTAPAFTAIANDLSTFESSSLAGKVRIINSVPSVDTGVCDAQIRRFNEEASKLGENVAILTVSMDLPFAQKRWCGAAGVEQVTTLSDYQNASFGQAYGTLIKEWRLCSRAVFVVDSNNQVVYAEYVPAAGEHPNYEAALEAARAAK